MKQQMTLTRRNAVKGLAVAAAAPALFAQGANEKIIVGAIGVGGRGRVHASGLAARPDVEIAFVCEADLSRAEQAAAEVEKAGGKRPTVVQDLRRILDDKSIDAVTVATPA